MRGIGLVGLGYMGNHYAKNLLSAGYSLTVLDVDAERVRQVVDLGANAARTSGELAEASDAVVLSLPSSEIVDLVMSGDDGVIAHLKPGQVVIDTSTSLRASHLKLVKLVEQAGGKMLDAPVTWREPGVTIMVGGDEQAFHDCEDVLNTIGAKVRYVGAAGQGQVAKSVNQMIGAGTGAVLAEALAFAAKGGLDLEQLAETLDIPERGLRIINREFRGTGTLTLTYKDLGYALATARQLGAATPLTALVDEIHKAVVAYGEPWWHGPALVTYWEKLSGIESEDCNSIDDHSL